MSEFRCDNYKLSRKVAEKIGDNGYGTFSATITKAGVFSYVQPDGSVIRELRHPDEVFSERSMNSLKSVPLVTENDHMKCLADDVGINQVSEFTTLGAVGGELYRNDKDEITGSITVYRPETLQKIDSGEERQLSAGYKVRINKTPGEYSGQPYDQSQENIIYGHVAVVRRGRAGTAEFRIDSKTAFLSDGKDNQKKEEKLAIIKIPSLNVGTGENSFRVDSLSIEESEGTSALLEQRNTLIDECQKAQARTDRAEGELDTLKADKNELEKQLKDAIPMSRFDSEIEERTQLNEMCSAFEIDTKGKTNTELKRAVCMKDKPGVYDKQRMDGDFLEGAFVPIASDWKNRKADIITEKSVINSINNNPDQKKVSLSEMYAEGLA